MKKILVNFVCKQRTIESGDKAEESTDRSDYHHFKTTRKTIHFRDK